MAGLVVLVHTIPALVGQFDVWCRDLMPDARVLHVLDEPLLERIKLRGRGAPEDAARLADHVALAESIGASAVLVTCSTVSQDVAVIADRFRIPVIGIDTELAAVAVAAGKHIALVATAASTIGPSTLVLRAAAARAGRRVAVRSRLVDGALAALLTGDGMAHDRLVTDAVREEATRADVVVLAQATMARVVPALDAAGIRVPVLASPPLAVASLARILASGAPSSGVRALEETQT